MSYDDFWFIDTRVQTRNLRRYLIWFILLFAFVTVGSYLAIKTMYNDIQTYEIRASNPSATVSEAKSTNVNGYIKGEIKNEDEKQIRVVVGMATCGIASGARPVLTTLSDVVQELGLDNVMVTQTGCIGLCQYEPIVEVIQPGKEKVTYVKMNPEKAMEVVRLHLVDGQVVTKYTLGAEKIGEK